jgi:hypothetical protein
MKHLFTALLGYLLFSCSYSYAEQIAKPFSGINHTYAKLLTGKDLQGVRLAAKSVVKDSRTDIRLVELAARKLFEESASSSKLAIDTLAWCARVIETHGTDRYLGALKQLHSNDIHKKLRKYISNAIDAVESRPAKLPKFDPSSKMPTLNLEPSKTIKKGDRNLKISVGDPITEVYQNLGYPIDVKVVSRRGGHGFFRVEITNLEATFEEYGTIIFARAESDSPSWTVRRIVENRALSTELLNSEFGRYISEINSNNPDNIRRIARQIYKERKFSTEILDHAAERILSEKALDDKRMLDAVAWLCRVLGASENSRYYSTIKHTAEKSESSKIRKYAKKALKSIQESSEEQYQLGQVKI